MPRYRDRLPQLDDDLFLTDGGLETTLLFHHDQELPLFAAFTLLETPAGNELFRQYYRSYAEVARERGLPFILEAMTWRASPKWGEALGYMEDELEIVNRVAIDLMTELRAAYENDLPEVVISGCIGPHDDAYAPEDQLTVREAEAYHSSQIETLRDTEADLATAFTLTYPEEAIGMARAAAAAEMPIAIGFTVETDGRLDSGWSLQEAIEEVDSETEGYPAYYMVNCAHPSHFEEEVEENQWTDRIRAVRANASTKSHAELDEATELDEGDPQELSGGYARLHRRLRNLNVLGGCCGTDERHLAAICDELHGHHSPSEA